MKKSIFCVLLVLLAACLFTACDGGTMEELWEDELGNSSDNGGDGPTPSPVPTPPPAPAPVTYKVTYVVNPDPTYGTPEGSTVPTDPTQYPPADPVIVKDQLTTTVDYAFNAKGEKISGTWTFTPWDKDDFQIYEDTTITGGWTFKPAPAPVKYEYTVHYVLWDDYLKGKTTKVADDEKRNIDQLGIEKTEPAKTGNDLKPKYRKNYQPVPGYESVTEKIRYDGYEIWIFYQKKSSSS